MMSQLYIRNEPHGLQMDYNVVGFNGWWIGRVSYSQVVRTSLLKLSGGWLLDRIPDSQFYV